jgi:hypothetical protein
MKFHQQSVYNMQDPATAEGIKRVGLILPEIRWCGGDHTVVVPCNSTDLWRNSLGLKRTSWDPETWSLELDED